MSSPNRSTDQPFVADGGIEPPVAHDADPYHTLDDLMVVVEALCPEWPVREVFKPSGKMLL